MVQWGGTRCKIPEEQVTYNSVGAAMFLSLLAQAQHRDGFIIGVTIISILEQASQSVTTSRFDRSSIRFLFLLSLLNGIP